MSLKAACLAVAIAWPSAALADPDPASGLCFAGDLVDGSRPVSLARAPKLARLELSRTLTPQAWTKGYPRAYAKGGDPLLIGPPVGSQVCAFDLRTKADGWVELSRLEKAPLDHSPPFSAWTGHWVETVSFAATSAEIDLTQAGKGLEASGDSSWDPPNVANSGPNIGDISATAVPQSNEADFTEKGGGCRVHMVLVAAWLLVSDNGCSGVHAEFVGVYQRRRGR